MHRRLIRWLVLCACFMADATGQEPSKKRALPPNSHVQAIVDQHFARQTNLRPGDLIMQSEVRALFPLLKNAGWDVENRDELLWKVLPAGDPLVRILRSPSGIKFMRQVSGYKLIYDRLDRVASASGGQRLLTDLIKLPDAARYAKQSTGRGVPDLIDFLPKDRSGKTRRIKDYDKATDKLYTVKQFKTALQESYEAAQKKPRV